MNKFYFLNALTFIVLNTSNVFSQFSIAPQFHLSLIDNYKWNNISYEGSGFNLKSTIKPAVGCGIALNVNYRAHNHIVGIGAGCYLLKMKGVAILRDAYLSYATGGYSNQKLYENDYPISQHLGYVSIPISYSYNIHFKENSIFSLRPKINMTHSFLLKNRMNHRLDNFALDFRSVDYYTYQFYVSVGMEFYFKHYFFGLFYNTALTDLNKNFKGLKLAQIRLTMGYEITFKKKEKHPK